MLKLFFKTKVNKKNFKTPEYDFRDQINSALTQTLPYLQIFNPCQSKPTKRNLKSVTQSTEYRVQSTDWGHV
jgi:hypothetical protein